jgi:hypothetical protein
MVLVSNKDVRILRFLRKFLYVTLLGFCACLSITILVSQIEQYVFRQQASRFLAVFQSIQLRETTWQEAQEKLRPWSADRKDSEGCNDHFCTTQVTLTESVFKFVSSRNLFVRLDDYFRWKLDLTYGNGPFATLSQFLLRAYVHLGGRPARIGGTIEIRDGIVWGKGFSFWVESYAKENTFPFSGGWDEYSLIAEARTVSRFGFYGPDWPASQLLLHPQYSIGGPSGCTGCIAGSTRFTPYAEQSDIRRFFDLNLSCLTRWIPCRTQEDVMPNAWSQHRREMSELRRSDTVPKCDSSTIQTLGRDSSRSFVAEVTKYRENLDEKGNHEAVVIIRSLEELKGEAPWVSEKSIEVSLQSEALCLTPRIQVGSKLIFFTGFDRPAKSTADLKQPWPTLPATKENLDSFMRGVQQDYRANDEPHKAN